MAFWTVVLPLVLQNLLFHTDALLWDIVSIKCSGFFCGLLSDTSLLHEATHNNIYPAYMCIFIAICSQEIRDVCSNKNEDKNNIQALKGANPRMLSNRSEMHTKSKLTPDLMRICFPA